MKTFANKSNAKRSAINTIRKEEALNGVAVDAGEAATILKDNYTLNGSKQEGFWYTLNTTKEPIIIASVEVEEEPVKTGLKIQKDREEKNGIKRPSEGGKCAAIWEACDVHYTETGIIPMPKVAKEWAAEKGWNVNNTVIELYQWRKFMGFIGRQTK